jgi:hypothetical protein
MRHGKRTAHPLGIIDCVVPACHTQDISQPTNIFPPIEMF